MLGYILDETTAIPKGETTAPAFPSWPEQIKRLKWLANDDSAQLEIKWDSVDRILDRFLLAILYWSRSNRTPLSTQGISGWPWKSK